MRANGSSLFGLVVLVGAAVVGLGVWEHVQTERLGARIAGAAKPGDIAMISSETCSYCGAARAWFQEHRVGLAECFIETDAAFQPVTCEGFWDYPQADDRAAIRALYPN